MEISRTIKFYHIIKRKSRCKSAKKYERDRYIKLVKFTNLPSRKNIFRQKDRGKYKMIIYQKTMKYRKKVKRMNNKENICKIA